MLVRFRIFLYLLVGLPTLGWSAPLRGVITDPTGEPIPFVSVYVENTTYGVAANAKGEYYLELEPGTHRVVFQMLGFATQTLTVEMGTSLQRINVVLELQQLELAEVTIYSSGRDPAYAIIEQAQEARKQYLQQFEAYTRTTYTKATSEVAPVKGIRS
ncbi:MAG TPA: hypothetical protein DCP28_25440, partial [Cytophagales bacterium]|nr:hypothetical protein [Cytophagales bacterium]